MRNDNSWTEQRMDIWPCTRIRKNGNNRQTGSRGDWLFTAWVDRYDKVIFRDDIYGHDKKIYKLFVKQ